MTTGMQRRRTGRRRRWPIWCIGALAAVSVGLVAVPGAGASCVGPAIRAVPPGTAPSDVDVLDEAEPVAPVPVDRGERVLVLGEAWGDNCYDTGPPPEGEGHLGVPYRGIELTIEQAGTRTLLARGNADREYRFALEVALPADLGPGPAVVRAAHPGLHDWEAVVPVEVSAQPAPSAGATGTTGATEVPEVPEVPEVTGFGPDGPPWGAGPEAIDPWDVPDVRMRMAATEPSGSVLPYAAGLAGGTAVLGGIAALLVRRRRVVPEEER